MFRRSANILVYLVKKKELKGKRGKFGEKRKELKEKGRNYCTGGKGEIHGKKKELKEKRRN